jgi:hypothetical protein
MPKIKSPAEAAEEEKRKGKRRTDADLDDALDDSFPASDPPSMTQPETEVGAPSRGRKPDPAR